MMGKRKVLKKTDVLSASEIGQYHYCSCAWHLQRCGYEPESPYLEIRKTDPCGIGRHHRWL